MKKIKLRSKYGELYSLIEDEDYELVRKYKWRAYKNRTKHKDAFYAVTDYYKLGKKTTIYMHRLIMGSPERPFVVDHINHNGLDNRRSNLRVVSYMKNRINSKGVDPDSLDMTLRGATIKIPVELNNSLWHLSLDTNRSIPNLIVDAIYYYFVNKHGDYLSKGNYDSSDNIIPKIEKSQSKLDVFG